jgi:hypothetical protein
VSERPPPVEVFPGLMQDYAVAHGELRVGDRAIIGDVEYCCSQLRFLDDNTVAACFVRTTKPARKADDA